MAYCQSCGQQNAENSTFCAACGAPMLSAAPTPTEQQTQQQQPYQQQTYQQPYQQQQQQTYQQPYQQQNPYYNQQQPNYYQQPMVEDKAESGLCVLCFFFWIVGVVLYATNKKEKPNAAKTYLKWGLIPQAIWIGLYLLFIIIAVFASI